MLPTNVVEIVTPKKFVLNGLWFGQVKPQRTIIWVNGLTSSAFSKLGIVQKLVDENTSVLTFNNRGSTTVTRIRKINPKSKDGYDYVQGGGAHEVFTECADDIQGAVDFARKHGAKEVYLAGHSTGAQKSAYYATRGSAKNQIQGVILLAPISDYASAVHFDTGGQLKKGLKAALALIKKGKKHDIVPGWWQDAQRFVSLHTPDSAEEIFSYSSAKKVPKTYRALTVPTLVLLAEEDEHSDRPATKIGEWFKENSRSESFALQIVEKVPHSFHGAEQKVAARIHEWVSQHSGK